ncbi:unnamed protein product [Calypogeia fissa]
MGSVATGAFSLSGGPLLPTVLVITVGVVLAVYIMHDRPSINTNSPTVHHNSVEVTETLRSRRAESSTV